MYSLWKSGSQLLLETPSFIHGLEPSATEVVRVPRAETARVFTVFLGSMHIVQLFLFKLLQRVPIAEAHAFQLMFANVASWTSRLGAYFGRLSGPWRQAPIEFSNSLRT